MTLRNSWPGPTGVTTTTDARYVLAGLVETDTAGVARSGLFPSNLTPVVTGRADMNIDIAAFTGVGVQFGGPVLIANDGTIQLSSVLVSPVSGTNYYVVYVKQNESTSPGTDASNLPVRGVVLSTTSFAAARATLPPGAVELATVQIPSGVSTTNAGGVTITQTSQFTAAEGGVVFARNATQLAAWTPADGSQAYRIDNAALYNRVGGAWVPAVRTATYTLLSNGVPDATVVTSAAMTAVSAETTDSSFITSISGTALTVKAGTYLVTMLIAVSSALTGRTFAQLDKGATVISRNNGQSGDDTVTTTSQVVIESDGIVITGKLFKTAGGLSNVTGRLTITKLY